MNKRILIALAAPIFVAGCISTDMGTAPATATAADAGVNAERGTGSNISRKDKDTVRQGVDREELERMQRPGGSNQIGKSGKT
jgi:hypothetical protein